MRRAARFHPAVAGTLAVLVLAIATAHATPPAAPVEIRLAIDGATVAWEIVAHADAALERPVWRSVPAGALVIPPALPTSIAAGERAAGRAPLGAGVDWVELRLGVQSALGAFEIGGSVGAPTGRPATRLQVVPRKPAARAPGTVVARFLYEDRLLDAGGYSGAVQLLPLRYADAELVHDSTGTVVARGSLDADGRLELVCDTAPAGRLAVRLWAATRAHPQMRLVVLDPDTLTTPGIRAAKPHALETATFELAPAGIDLGTLVATDPDGFGHVQAFHILDVAIDAWETLGGGDLVPEPPGPADSLRFVWSTRLRLRGTAYGSGHVQVSSPVGGDTDGWCDPILLHEIGHYVAHRWLRDSSPGGIHLLGDVEQDLELAWSEGLASAFACWVRWHRAVTRRNIAGLPMDGEVQRVIDVGLPPPPGTAGGLQWAWDVEAHALGLRPLPRDGTGSETTIAGVLWDASDDAATPDGGAGDDDPVALGLRPVWEALRRLHDLPPGTPVRFEEFYGCWTGLDPDGATIAPVLREARIDYEPDAAEPDALWPPALGAVRPQETGGGVVVSEIVLGPRIAVEIANRGAQPVALGGWKLVARSNTASTAPGLTFTIPPLIVLGPGGRLVVHRRMQILGDGVRDIDADHWTAPWFPGIEGALMLLDPGGAGVDFVRWNSRDGTRSVIAPPAGATWSGDLAAAEFGESLARRPELADSDAASDFGAGEPTLGAPNDVTAIHRTFFPDGDVDAVHLAPESAGVYTLAGRRLRNGAGPRIEIWSAGGVRPILRTVVTPGDAPPRVTLRFAPGEVLEARIVQAGSTRFGSYDLAFFAEPDSAMPLPPTAVRAAVSAGPEGGRVRLEWRNAAVYDSVRTRVGAGDWLLLPGDATAWDVELPRGRQTLDIAAYAGGRSSRLVALVVAVEPWSASLDEPFDSLATDQWETTGTWSVTEAAGGNGRVLASTPGATYANNERGEVRLRSAVLAGPATVLRFEHVCIVRPEDSARIEITDDWGATWERLASWDWFGATGDSGAANWRDGVADPIDWVGEELSLGAWAGRPVQLRFVFESDIFGVARGWLVDGLRIEPGSPSPPPRYALQLFPCVPNPFNPQTRLRFEVAQPAHVVLRIFDVRGRLLSTLLDAPQSAGPHEIVWRGEDGRGRTLPSGVYVAELRAGGETRTTKVVRID